MPNGEIWWDPSPAVVSAAHWLGVNEVTNQTRIRTKSFLYRALSVAVGGVSPGLMVLRSRGLYLVREGPPFRGAPSVAGFGMPGEVDITP